MRCLRNVFETRPFCKYISMAPPIACTYYSRRRHAPIVVIPSRVMVLTVNDSCLHVASRSCIKGCPRALRKIIITSSLFSELSVRRPTFRFEQIALARSRIRSFLIRSRSRSPLNRLSISRRDIRRTFNVFAYPITASTLVRVYPHHPLFVYLIPIGSIHFYFQFLP